MESFYELVKNRRSIRKYAERPVERALLERVLTTALMAPASKRANGWEFIVVDNREMLQRLSQCREFGSQFVANAPAAIVVAYDETKSDVWFEDASIASLLLQLAAADEGLGTCWVQVYNRNCDAASSAEAYVARLLGLPEHLRVLNMVTIGYKNEERRPYDEAKLLYGKVHQGAFGVPFEFGK